MANMANPSPATLKQMPTPSPADNRRRFEVAASVLPQIVQWQLSGNRAGQEDLAASMAFRFADRLIAQAEKAPVNTVVARGVVTAPPPSESLEAAAFPPPEEALTQLQGTE